MADAHRFRAPGPGVWTLDRAHFPRPASRYVRSIAAAGVTDGLRESFARYGFPLKGVAVAWQHGRCYFRLEPIIEGDNQQAGPAAEAAVWLVTRVHPGYRQRTRAARTAFGERLWLKDLDRWTGETEPRLRRRNLALQAVDPGLLADADLAEHLAAAAGNLRDGLRVHYGLFPAYAIPLGELFMACREWGLSAAQLLTALRGRSPATGGPGLQIRRLAVALDGALPVRSLDEVRRAGPQASALLDQYLRDYGNHVIGSLDVDDLTVGELPEVLLAALNAAGGGEDLAAASADQAVDRLRQTVPAAERARFDVLFDDAAASFHIRDGNVGVTELWPAGLLRRALRAVGHRLVDRGGLAEWCHVMEAEPEEAAALLRGAGPPMQEMCARREERRRQAGFDAPWQITESTGTGAGQAAREGAPDPRLLRRFPEPLARIARIMITMAPLYESPPAGGRMLSGTGIGVRNCVGRATVVRDAAEALRRLEPGDILVTGTTTPAYNTVLPVVAGFVVEHGGEFSHSAIMASELGLPAIVGVERACELIKDGQEIEIDPVSGVVMIH